jgi:hypothetical protein
MSVIQWPAPMPETGRLPQAKLASGDGKAKCGLHFNNGVPR